MYGASDQQWVTCHSKWVTCHCENSDSPDRTEPGPPCGLGANPERHTARKTVTQSPRGTSSHRSQHVEDTADFPSTRDNENMRRQGSNQSPMEFVFLITHFTAGKFLHVAGSPAMTTGHRP